MSRRLLRLGAVIVGVGLLVAGHAAVTGQEQQPVEPAASKVAVPSQAAPFQWSTPVEAREPGQVPQAEQETLGREFLRAFHPLRLLQLEHEKGQNPAEYYQMVREAYHQRWELEHLRLGAPEEFARREQTLQLNARCEQLALRYRDATPDQQPAIEAQLRNLADQVFDQRQGEMEEHLRELEREYKRMKAMVEKRRKYRDKVVEIQVLRLLGEQEIFELW